MARHTRTKSQTDQSSSDVWLIRHAEARLGPSLMDADYHLTARGARQAQALGRKLAASNIKPARIWHSPMIRARETARILAQHTGAPLKAHRGLIEFGTRVLTLKCSLKEAVRRYPRWIRPDGSLTWSEGQSDLSKSFRIGDESLRQLHRRAKKVWREITAQIPPGNTVLVVAHSSLLSAMLTEALGVPPADVWRFNFPHTGIVRVKLVGRGRACVPVLCASQV